MASAATPAIAVLVAADVAHEVLRYHHDPRNAAFGDEAVAHLTATAGVSPDQIFKTLVIVVPTGLAVAVLPVPYQLSLKAAAAALGVKSVRLADQAVAERATGYVVGGISPLGQRKRLPAVADAGIRSFPTVYVSAGRRGLQVELAPDDLLELTGAVVAEIGRHP